MLPSLMIGLRRAAHAEVLTMNDGNAPSAIASISVDRTETGVKLTGRALALSKCTLDARMTIDRSGPNGRASTTTGGTFALQKDESVDVGVADISMTAGDRLSAKLTLTSGGHELATSSVNVGS
jgi:hypothetical protein